MIFFCLFRRLSANDTFFRSGLRSANDGFVRRAQQEVVLVPSNHLVWFGSNGFCIIL
jgi:hypothetical protein